nr:SPW repeat protein [Thermalbibacter longus]
MLGVWLFLSPWILGTTDDSSNAWNAWLVGLGVAVVALWALAAPTSQLAERINVVLAAWLFVAPWLLGFTDLAEAAWNAWIVRVLVAGLALWAIFDVRRVSTTA